MTGSLQSMRGKYYAVLNMKDPSNPKKRRQKWVSLGIADIPGNKTKAKQALNKLLVECDERGIAHYTELVPQIQNDVESALFCDYVKEWLESVKADIEVSTYESYQLMIDNHIYPFFSKLGVLVGEVTTEHIRSYYDEKGKKLSACTQRKHHAVINQALKAAARQDLLPHNPADKITLPKVEQYTGKFLSIAQGKKLLEAAKGTSIETAVRLGIAYGLRRSEIVGLRWSAIDFENDTITINHTVTSMSTLIAKDRTKNKSSNRTLPLIPNVKEWLLQLREQQEQAKALCGSEYKDSEYVFRRIDGSIFSCSTLSKSFKTLLAKNGLPPIRLHDLRHTCASYMLKAGVNLKVISEYLGHSQIGTTMNIYGHIDIEAKKEAATAIGSMLQNIS